MNEFMEWFSINWGFIITVVATLCFFAWVIKNNYINKKIKKKAEPIQELPGFLFTQQSKSMLDGLYNQEKMAEAELKKIAEEGKLLQAEEIQFDEGIIKRKILFNNKKEELAKAYQKWSIQKELVGKMIDNQEQMESALKGD